MKLWSLFHLNLAYSAIPVSLRSEVIERCYWPLLRVAEERDWPIGIEASGWTLREIQEHDSRWVPELARLIRLRKVEFIGSGYCQVISPLVPSKVNEKNVEIGWHIYEELLACHPNMALLPEQAFSAGHLDTLRDIGCDAFVMDWNNAYAASTKSAPERQNPSSMVRTASGHAMKALWSNSLSFQKFQRYVHGELEATDLVDWLTRRISGNPSLVQSLYSNDAEIFDYRPGRYLSEARIQDEGEWNRISQLIGILQEESHIELLLPREALEQTINLKEAPIRIGSDRAPSPVKKQAKYNIVRWAVSGRDDFTLNSKCHLLLQAMTNRQETGENQWAQLLEWWASDYRTHIEEDRWKRVQESINSAISDLPPIDSAPSQPPIHSNIPTKHSGAEPSISVGNRFLSITSQRVSAEFDLSKGLAVASWVDRELGNSSLFGTLPLGHFNAISLGADFFSGHVTFEPPGQHKVTDLVPVTPRIVQNGPSVTMSFALNNPLGRIFKSVELDTRLGLYRYRYRTILSAQGSLRFGYLNLFEEAFDFSRLYFRTHLGGVRPELFRIGTEAFDHGRPVSNLVSASHALGVTEGTIQIGDGRRELCVVLDPDCRGAVAMLANQIDTDEQMVRLYFSAQEVDDTSLLRRPRQLEFGATVWAQLSEPVADNRR